LPNDDSYNFNFFSQETANGKQQQTAFSEFGPAKKFAASAELGDSKNRNSKLAAVAVCCSSCLQRRPPIALFVTLLIAPIRILPISIFSSATPLPNLMGIF
jgi:hypothetical protein